MRGVRHVGFTGLEFGLRRFGFCGLRVWVYVGNIGVILGILGSWKYHGNYCATFINPKP